MDKKKFEDVKLLWMGFFGDLKFKYIIEIEKVSCNEFNTNDPGIINRELSSEIEKVIRKYYKTYGR